MFRITRLATEDFIFDRPRDWVVDRSRLFGEMLTCPWCASFWLSIPAAVMFYFWPEVTYWLSLPFAFSAVTGLLSRD